MVIAVALVRVFPRTSGLLKRPHRPAQSLQRFVDELALTVGSPLSGYNAIPSVSQHLIQAKEIGSNEAKSLSGCKSNFGALSTGRMIAVTQPRQPEGARSGARPTT